MKYEGLVSRKLKKIGLGLFMAKKHDWSEKKSVCHAPVDGAGVRQNLCHACSLSNLI
jgi:hypothetical protein